MEVCEFDDTSKIEINKNSVYIALIEKTDHKAKQVNGVSLFGCLVKSYLNYARNLGYKMCYLWAEPPDSESPYYIFSKLQSPNPVPSPQPSTSPIDRKEELITK